MIIFWFNDMFFVSVSANMYLQHNLYLRIFCSVLFVVSRSYLRMEGQLRNTVFMS